MKAALRVCAAPGHSFEHRATVVVEVAAAAVVVVAAAAAAAAAGLIVCVGRAFSVCVAAARFADSSCWLRRSDRWR